MGSTSGFPKPDYALAFHVAAELEAGHIAASETIQYSSSDSVELVVHGVGTHGASPQLGKDPVWIGAQIVTALQGVISRSKSPLAARRVITVGTFHAGTKNNIISDRADLGITVRANDEATRAELIAGIRQVVDGVGRANGLSGKDLPEVAGDREHPDHDQRYAASSAAQRRRWRRALPPGTVVPFVQKNMGAEDFAYFVQPDTKRERLLFCGRRDAQSVDRRGGEGRTTDRRDTTRRCSRSRPSRRSGWAPKR